MRDFRSDNVAGVAPEILEALARAGEGPASSYGDDPWTAALQARLSELFETGVRAFPVATGTAANALALACLAPPYGVVYCHRHAHIEEDECGAPEFFTGGAKLHLLPGAHGRIGRAELAARLAAAGQGVQHHAQPAAISLAQATEAGTAYRPEDIAELAGLARSHGLGVHMDGARFANALSHLGRAPADLTWRAGVDVLSLGATKGGAMAAEAVVFFRPELAEGFLYRRKRAGHLLSKQRFVSAQLMAWLEGGLWLRLAAHANAMAARLAHALEALPGAALVHPVEANEVFAALPEAAVAALEDEGFLFHRWPGESAREAGAAPGAAVIRLVTAWNTEAGAVDALARAAASAVAAVTGRQRV